MAGTQYVTRTVTQLEYRRQADATGTEFEMIEAQFTTKGPQSWRKWETCPISGWSFPESEMRRVGGALYCTRFKHYLDKIMEEQGIAIRV